MKHLLYKRTKELRSFFMFEAVILGFMAWGSVMIVKAVMGRGEDHTAFLPSTLWITGSFFLTLTCTIILFIGSKRDWKRPIIAVSSFAIVAHVAFLIFLIHNEVKSIPEGGSGAVNYIGSILAVCGIISGTGALRETLAWLPGATRFNNGIVIDFVEKKELPILQDIMDQTPEEPETIKMPTIREISTWAAIRVVRVENEVCGFIIVSKDFKDLRNLFVAASHDDQYNEIHDYLMQDFARTYSRSNELVSEVTIPASDTETQETFYIAGYDVIHSDEKAQTVTYAFTDELQKPDAM